MAKKKTADDLYRFDDGGRQGAGLIGTTGDCCVRALSIVWRRSSNQGRKLSPGLCYMHALAAHLAGESWEIREGLCDLHVDLPMVDPAFRMQGGLHGGVGWRTALTCMGFREICRVGGKWRPSWREVLRCAARHKGFSFIVAGREHLSAIVEGVYRDSWNVLSNEKYAGRVEGVWSYSPPVSFKRDNAFLRAKQKACK